MNQLETLLNTLIARGWKPFGMEIHAEYIDRIVVEGSAMHIIFKGDGEYIEGLRALVSQESGLWQFCTEKELTKSKTSEYVIERYIKQLITRKEGTVIEGESLGSDLDYEYWLLSSALVPEEKLGKFLVDNIAIGGKKE